VQKEKIWTLAFTITMSLNFVFYLLTVIIGTVAMTLVPYWLIHGRRVATYA